MLSKTIFITKDVVLAVHEEQLDEHGGAVGLRDDGSLLEATLGRPQNLETYGDPPADLADLAAAYAFGFSRNHPFTDGNKRTSLVVTLLFLSLNGVDLHASQGEKVEAWLRLAAGEFSQEDLAEWIRQRLV